MVHPSLITIKRLVYKCMTCTWNKIRIRIRTEIRISTDFGSSTSNSRMTRSVMSGKWCELQKEKYAESVRRMAPFVSSEAGWGKTVFHHWKKRAG